jgi:hypothetical protein
MFPNLDNKTAFSVAELTAAINILPNMYGRINEMGLFPVKGVKTRSIYVEEMSGVLTLLPTKPVGSPGTAGKKGKRKVRSFAIPHIPHDDIVHPDDVAGVRAFGSDDELQPIIQEVNDRLQSMKNKHDITLEHLRMGALKGVILDADGTTLYNLFTEFDITKKTVDFLLGTAGTEIIKKCTEVVRHIEQNLKGEVMSGVRALVSPEFFDKLVSHAKVKEAYARWQNGEALRNPDRKDFRFGNITFEENNGQCDDPDGSPRRFISANYGTVFPTGTTDTFKTHCAPADFNETVNTIGQPYYAKMEERKHGRGYDLHTQSNPLPLCHRPAVLVEIKSSN